MTMRITVERFVSDDDTTVSLIFLDGAFCCFGLEDEHREEKIARETRIPAGTYAIKLRTAGGMNARYGRRFPDFHRGMLWLQDVPNFTWIYIHVGNTDDHTAGCLLVGEGAMCSPTADMSVQASVRAYERLYREVVDAAEAGELDIEIIDRDLTNPT